MTVELVIYKIILDKRLKKLLLITTITKLID